MPTIDLRKQLKHLYQPSAINSPQLAVLALFNPSPSESCENRSGWHDSLFPEVLFNQAKSCRKLRLISRPDDVDCLLQEPLHFQGVDCEVGPFREDLRRNLGCRHLDEIVRDSGAEGAHGRYHLSFRQHEELAVLLHRFTILPLPQGKLIAHPRVLGVDHCRNRLRDFI